MMIVFGDIFGIGGSSLISRLFGEKRDEEAKRVSAFWRAYVTDGGRHWNCSYGSNYNIKNYKKY